MSLRVIAFKGENFKKLKAWDIAADPNVNEITGGNEQGKTSLLDALEAVFQAKEVLRRTPEPIRKGEEKAYVIADLGDLVVTRTFTAKGEYLKVENKDGAVFRSPQEILNKITGKLTFDPLAFSNLKDKEQLETLLGLVEIPLDLEAWAAERAEVFDGRTVTNREIKAIEGQIQGITFPDDTPDEEVSAASVLIEQREAQEVNESNATKRRLAHNAKAELERQVEVQAALQRDIREIERELIETTEKLASVGDTITKLKNVCATHDEECAALVDIDFASFQDRISEVEATNCNVRLKKSKSQLTVKLTEQKVAADNATVKLGRLDLAREQALKAANMPIADLSFNDHGVTYKGIPFRQCSSEERLRVSIAMGMALNSKLRVMFIRDGSLLDAKHRAVIQQMAIDNEYQLWIERVDDSGKVGLYFEDGEIVNQPKVKTKKAAANG